jgi:hypothetical protein
MVDRGGGADKRIDKYLATHAEPEVRCAQDLAAGDAWDQVVVVPVRDESADLLETVRGPARSGAAVLLILVVNGSAASAANEGILRRFAASVAPESSGRTRLHRAPEADVLVVDRASAGRTMGPKQGVGLARKIGCDIALALQRRGALASPWIHLTDADASLHENHCRAIESLPGDVVAHVASFAHVSGGEPSVDQATWAHERWLRYYVLGLSFADSAHAHHSLGSLISVRGDAYAAVRGVPRRLAGEDFYLLNKLRKLGPIEKSRGGTVRIVSRRSQRVPFGTGPAVEAALAGQGRRYLDPRCFEELGHWQDVLRRGAEGDAIEELLGGCSAVLAEAVNESGDLEAVRQVCARHPAKQRARRLAEVFDGFRTLKLLHALRDLQWPLKSWDEVRAEAPFLRGLEADSLEAQCRALAELESRAYAERQMPRFS